MAATVYERVEAMPVIFDMLPSEPTPGSAFAEGRAASTVRDLRRRPDALAGRRREARAGCACCAGGDAEPLRHPPHPAPPSPAAKGMWIVDPDEASARAARSCAVVAADRMSGAEAMTAVTANGGPDAFAQIGDRFQAAHDKLVTTGKGFGPVKLPGDGLLIMEAARRVDQYYGTTDAVADARLLWNASADSPMASVCTPTSSTGTAEGRSPRR